MFKIKEGKQVVFPAETWALKWIFWQIFLRKPVAKNNGENTLLRMSGKLGKSVKKVANLSKVLDRSDGELIHS